MPKPHTQNAPQTPHRAGQPLPAEEHVKTTPRSTSRDLAACRGVPVFFEGYDEALIGTCDHVTAPNRNPMTVAVYSKALIIEIMERTMTPAVAEATFKGNILAQWHGATTPLIVDAL